MALPIITKTTDIAGSTIDDAAYLPDPNVYQCQTFSVDVKGPGLPGPTDITWTVKDSANATVTGVISSGQNTITATFNFPTSKAPGEYKIIAALTSDNTQTSNYTFTLLPLPNITVGTPNQAHVGGQTQFNTAYPFGVDWSPGELGLHTGLATWTTAGVKSISYTPTGQTCPITLEYLVYPAVAVAQYNGVDPIYLNAGDTVALTVTGGSNSYTYSITGQNTISNTGVVQAGLYAGNYTITIVDNGAGVIQTIPVSVGSQSQFCVQVDQQECATETSAPCCEITLDCGESVYLQVPSFHKRENGVDSAIIYESYGGGQIGEGGYLKSSSAGITDAKANTINCNSNESLFEIVTSLDMSDIANDAFGIGFSQFDIGSGVNSIDTGVIWFTESGVRKIEVRQSGVALAGSKFAIVQGDVVSAGYRGGIFTVYVNNLLKYENASISCCGNQFIDIAIEEQSKALGGFITGLTWTITTAGNPADVGTISSTGIYAAPQNTNHGLVQAEATVGNATFRINIRNVKPSVRDNNPQSRLAGRNVTIWVGKYIPNFNETVRLAKDGSPDAIQNPGMIELGVLEANATFAENNEYQDFDDDQGTYRTAISKEAATLTGDFLEIRNLAKMALLMPHTTLHPKNNGVTSITAGGKVCNVGELRVIMVMSAGANCEDGQYDVLYLPRVQNKGNLGMDVGRKSASKYGLSLSAIIDPTRPPGRQLWELLEIDTCKNTSCAV